VQLKHGYIFLLAAALMLGGCTSRQSAEQRRADANTPAGKVGQAAHKVAIEADKASKVAARKIQQAAHDAKAGWQEDAQKSKATR
jgi:hypothetical protein